MLVDDDFDLDRIAESGQCFRWELRGEGTYRIPLGERCLYIRALGDGRFDLDCGENDLALWREYFDLKECYSAIRARPDPRSDPFLAECAASERGIRILRQDPWEVTVSFIISQNRNIPAIRRSVELLCRAAGKSCVDGRGEAFYSFPEPEAILALSERELNECRLGYRGRYVRAAAAAAMDGTLDFPSLRTKTPEAARDALTELYGVGIKVASCIQLFGLHQLDAFPVDTWVRRILENEYPDGYPFEEYSPYNGVYQQYMFAFYRHKAL